MQKKLGNKALLNRVFKQVPIEDIIARCEKELGMQRELRPGDKVIIRVKGKPSIHPNIIEEMLDLEGRVTVINAASSMIEGCWLLTDHPFAWRSEWLELVEE